MQIFSIAWNFDPVFSVLKYNVFNVLSSRKLILLLDDRVFIWWRLAIFANEWRSGLEVVFDLLGHLLVPEITVASPDHSDAPHMHEHSNEMRQDLTERG